MSQLRNHLDQLVLWKRVLWLFFAIGSPIITAILTIWLFTLHGTVGLFIWFPYFSVLLVIIIIFAILGPLTIFLTIEKDSTTFLKIKKIAWVFCIISLMISSIFFIYVGGTLALPPRKTEPILLICDGSGKYDVPDMAVTYWTEQAEKHELKWGESSLSETIKEKEATTSHVFILEDLKPGREYWYQLDGEKDTYKFTTPLINNTLSLAISSDPHFGREASVNDVTVEILEQIKDNNLDLFFMLGDFVEYGFMRDQWEEGIKEISPYVSEIPFRPGIGNHDTIFAGTKRYVDYYYPEGMPLDTGSRVWYHITIGDIHIFMLDLEWGTETYNAEQQEWFEKEIQEVDKDDWTIVMSHCFYYSSGNMAEGMPWYDHQPMIDTFADIFEENDVDIVFSGHNHHAEILEKSGIYYQIVGTFGGLPDPKAEYKSPHSQWYHNMEDKDDFGYFQLDIHGDNATLAFRNRNNDSLKEITIEK
ncbi:MAG: metallophosphoesterase family protein [Promethearchaeota archaeon]